MDARITVSLSQFLVPCLIAFIGGMVAGVCLVVGADARAGAQRASLVLKNERVGAGWAVILLLGAMVGIALVAGWAA